MAEYEFTVLYHPDLEIDIDKALSKVEKILKDASGKVIKMDNWGKRKLAYPINKEDHAVYVYYDIELPGESVSKVEGILNITDEVLRYLIVKPGPEIEEEDEDSDESDSKSKDTKDADNKKDTKAVKKEVKKDADEEADVKEAKKEADDDEEEDKEDKKDDAPKENDEEQE